MTLLAMSDKEIKRVQVVDDVLSGHLSCVQAGEILGLSDRQVRRLCRRVLDEGVAGLVSRRRDRPSNRRYPDSFRGYVLELIRSNYPDFGPTLAAEKLEEIHDISLSVGTVRTWMIEDGLWKTRNYSDKHSVFRVNGKNKSNGITQFGRALDELNIDIICANTSQAKGRVERANKTLQDRLVKELRLRGICTIREANEYAPKFVEDFNQRFGRIPHNPKDLHRELDSEIELDDVFAWREERTVTNSLSIQYDRVMYLLEPTREASDLRRKKVTVYDYPDGTVSVKYKGIALAYSIFDKAAKVDQGAIVENKRLGAALAYAQEFQATHGLERSKKAPKRRGQKQIAEERTRQTNPAVV